MDNGCLNMDINRIFGIDTVIYREGEKVLWVLNCGHVISNNIILCIYCCICHL